MSVYTLRVENNSVNSTGIAVYQKNPNIGVPNVKSVVWFSEYLYPGTSEVFNFTTDYSFVWYGTSCLVRDTSNQKTYCLATATSNQIQSANLNRLNQITLSYNREKRAYHFTDHTAGLPTDSLIIEQTPDIPMKEAWVGIGMSKRATFVVQAEPNLKLIFTPQPSYWITFGEYKDGDILDMTRLTNEHEIIFTGPSMTATLNQDNTWTVKEIS